MWKHIVAYILLNVLFLFLALSVLTRSCKTIHENGGLKVLFETIWEGSSEADLRKPLAS